MDRDARKNAAKVIKAAKSGSKAIEFADEDGTTSRSAQQWAARDAMSERDDMIDASEQLQRLIAEQVQEQVGDELSHAAEALSQPDSD